MTRDPDGAPSRTRVTLDLNDEDHRLLKELATESGGPASEVLRTLIRLASKGAGLRRAVMRQT